MSAFDDISVLLAACGALVSFGDVATHLILSTHEVGATLIQHLRHNSTLIATAPPEALEQLADSDLGAMPQILRLILDDCDRSVKNGAVKVASRIAANGSPEHIQEVVCHGLLYALVDVFGSLPLETKEEVARAILGVTSRATPKIMKIVTERCVEALDLMVNESQSSVLITRCLEGLDTSLNLQYWSQDALKALIH